MGLALVLAGCGGPPAEGGPPGLPVAPEPDAAAPADYVAVGPRALLAAVAPLLQHRQAQGHAVTTLALEDLAPQGIEASSAEIAAGLRRIAAPGRLRFVLLVGDAPTVDGYRGRGPDWRSLESRRDRDSRWLEPQRDPSLERFTSVPTFYLPKLAYGGRSGESYPSDLPYAYAASPSGRREGTRPLAVGRVPARTAAEASAFARKVIDYETAPARGAWQRRIAVIGGPANFGAVADRLIEGTATRLLDAEVPYEYDVGVVFPKLDSAYAYPPPAMRAKLVHDLEEGALFAAYVGHGAATSFEDVWFRGRWFDIGTADDAARLRIGAGNPVFFSIACDTGAFDRPDASIAEALIMNPHGAIAVLASSRVSHPYPNALYGEGLIESFIQRRAPTIGEGVLLAKERMLAGAMPLAELFFDTDVDELKAEHEGLYNLFGDPATVPRYPDAAEVRTDRSSPVEPGAAIAVEVEASGAGRATVRLTLETRRSVIRGEIVAPSVLETLSDDEASAAMMRNHRTASNKVLWSEVRAAEGGRAAFRLSAPREPGDYALKAIVEGGDSAAVGHRALRVERAASTAPAAARAGAPRR